MLYPNYEKDLRENLRFCVNLRNASVLFKCKKNTSNMENYERQNRHGLKIRVSRDGGSLVSLSFMV